MAVFSFLMYIKPIWYFNLRPKIDHGYFLSKKEIEISVTQEEDTNYVSLEARKRDWAWSFFHTGFVSREPLKGLNFFDDSKLPIADEYRFIKKNFSAFWSLYVLFLRLLSLHKPITELKGYFKARNVERVHPYKSTLDPSYKIFSSKLVASKPKVSIVIPTLNRYTYLKNVLLDLERQTYKQIEVLVVDQSEPYYPEFYLGWNIPLNQWNQKEKALWKARNDAILKCSGDLVLLYDDDSRVEPDWIEQHLKAIDYFNADISSGVSLSEVGDKIPPHYSFFRWSDQLDTGNVLIKRKVFEEIGLFDRQFEGQRMGDGEFGLRAYLAGFRNVSNPLAKRIHLKVAQGGLRQMGYWDGWRPKSIFSPRPVPSVLYYYRKYFGNRATLFGIMSTIIPSVIPYRFKKEKKLLVLALLFLPIILPVVLVQVIVSWHRASEKLKQGALISDMPPGVFNSSTVE